MVKSAQITIDKATSLTFQEITVFDRDLRISHTDTLTETKSSLSMQLEPGSYVVTAMAPSGRMIERKIKLSAGETRSLIFEPPSGSPHEWLYEPAQRQNLPRSDIIVGAALHPPSFSLPPRLPRRKGGRARLEVDLLAFTDTGPSYSIARRAYAIPGNNWSDRPVAQRIRTEFRSYSWSQKHLRWVRSELIDEVWSDISDDYLRMSLSGRANDERIHLVGAFREGQRASFLSFPRFAEGAQLVVSETLDHSEPDRSRISWRLSANDERLDAMLQSLGGRRFKDADAVAESAIRYANQTFREKIRDPEAAIVAALFLLEHQRLDARADWLDNLVTLFPWSPDAQVLGAWGKLLFRTGEADVVRRQLARTWRAGPPQFARSRYLLRNLLSVSIAQKRESPSGDDRQTLLKLWKRLDHESRRVADGGPFYALERDDANQDARSPPLLDKYIADQGQIDRAARLSPSIDRQISRESRVTKAIFPIAGLGTRFLPATKSIPKELMTLVDRPLIQYAIDEARAAGIKDFIFVTSRGKSALEDYFDDAPELENALRKKGKDALLEELKSTNMDSGVIAYVRQNRPLGLGHAVWCARRLISPNESFAVILPDDVIVAEKPCLKQMIEAYEETGGNMVAAMEVPNEKTSSYGILGIKTDSGSIVSVKSIVEKPMAQDAPSNLAVIGRYILAPSVLENLNKLKPGAGGEIQLTDAIAREVENGIPVNGFRFRGQRFDCGSKAGFLQATVAFGLSRDDLRDELLDYLRECLAANEAKSA